MNISVIIPAYNEAELIRQTVSAILERADGALAEIIVADGGSTDKTTEYARAMGAKVLTSPKGRAVQMNAGAREASGDILYFLHADSIPPEKFDRTITEAVSEGDVAGCFRLSFDSHHPLLRFYAWFTRFDVNAFRFGDQSLFIKREVFEEAGGFREDHIVMEDNEIVRRIRREYGFRIIPESVTTSARKYRETGVLKLQLVFTLIFVGYYMGVPQATLVSWYKKFIR